MGGCMFWAGCSSCCCCTPWPHARKPQGGRAHKRPRCHSHTHLASAQLPMQPAFHRSLMHPQVVGRKIGVCSNPQVPTSNAKWRAAQVLAFDSTNGKHKVQYGEDAGAVAGAHEWLVLSSTKFCWEGEPPASAEPHPSYQTGPQGQAAVNRRLWVWWPGTLHCTQYMLALFHA